MKKYFTRTFFRFLFGFLVIIAVAFLGIIVTAPRTQPVDNVAMPQ